MSKNDENASVFMSLSYSPLLSSKESFDISHSTEKSEIACISKSSESSDNSAKKRKYDKFENDSDSSSDTTEIVVTGVKTPWPSEGELGPSLGTLYGLNPQFLKSLGITPPLDKWVHITNFRCDKSELKEVLELAGHVVICAMVSIRERYAKVMYNHPLEAVQAVSMLNGQTFYGQKLSVTMVRCPPETIILPKGLMKVGPGLGTKGLPLRDIVKHYKKYMKQKDTMVDTKLFTRSDDWNLSNEVSKKQDNISKGSDIKLLDEDTKEASREDLNRKRNLSESVIIKSVEDLDYVETPSPNKRSKNCSDESSLSNVASQGSDSNSDDPPERNLSLTFESTEKSLSGGLAITRPDASMGFQSSFESSVLRPVHSFVSTSSPISPSNTARPLDPTVGSSRPMGSNTNSSALPSTKQISTRVSCPPGFDLSPSGSPGLNMRLTGPPGFNRGTSGPLGSNISLPAPPGLNLSPTPSRMNMGSNAPPGINGGTSSPSGINMSSTGPPGMAIRPPRLLPNMGPPIPGIMNRGPASMSSGFPPANMAFRPSNMNSGPMTGQPSPFRPGPNVPPPLANPHLRPSISHMPTPRPSTQMLLPESLTLQFSNLPPSTTFPLLCEKVSQCGQVLSLQLTTPGCAVARFSVRAHADRCFHFFNGKCIEGCVIEVRFV